MPKVAHAEVDPDGRLIVTVEGESIADCESADCNRVAFEARLKHGFADGVILKTDNAAWPAGPERPGHGPEPAESPENGKPTRFCRRVFIGLRGR